MKRCWDIKSCPFSGTDPADSKCPAYAAQTACWDYDWLRFYDAMPDGSEKAEWKRMMLEWCASCAVRSKHGEKIDAFMEKLRSTQEISHDTRATESRHRRPRRRPIRGR